MTKIQWPALLRRAAIITTQQQQHQIECRRNWRCHMTERRVVYRSCGSWNQHARTYRRQDRHTCAARCAALANQMITG